MAISNDKLVTLAQLQIQATRIKDELDNYTPTVELGSLANKNEISEKDLSEELRQTLNSINNKDDVLPKVADDDNGRVLIVENGKWVCNDLPIYDGEYTVTPLADGEQTLLTKGKYNTRDITVKKIPYYEVSNDEGGTTINIG